MRAAFSTDVPPFFCTRSALARQCTGGPEEVRGARVMDGFVERGSARLAQLSGAVRALGDSAQLEPIWRAKIALRAVPRSSPGDPVEACAEMCESLWKRKGFGSRPGGHLLLRSEAVAPQDPGISTPGARRIPVAEVRIQPSPARSAVDVFPAIGDFSIHATPLGAHPSNHRHRAESVLDPTCSAPQSTVVGALR
jgi:hypothetical protein